MDLSFSSSHYTKTFRTFFFLGAFPWNRIDTSVYAEIQVCVFWPCFSNTVNVISPIAFLCILGKDCSQFAFIMLEPADGLCTRELIKPLINQPDNNPHKTRRTTALADSNDPCEIPRNGGQTGMLPEKMGTTYPHSPHLHCNI